MIHELIRLIRGWRRAKDRPGGPALSEFRGDNPVRCRQRNFQEVTVPDQEGIATAQYVQRTARSRLGLASSRQHGSECEVRR